MFNLMVVTDRARCRLPLVDAVKQALEGGADAVQLRERDLEGKELFELAEQLRTITRAAGASLIVNHRLDVALAVEADAIHLSWRSVAPLDARRLGGRNLKVGVSCHDIDQLRRAEMNGVQYALLGPVFPTPSKEGLVQAIGLDHLKQWAHATRLPVVAIGGINTQNCAEVRQTGVRGIAVISAIMSAEDPAAAARMLKG